MYLPAYTRQYVHVTPNRNLDKCLEVRVELAALEEEGVWIEDAVADIEQDRRIIVGLVNSSPQGVTLQRRMYLAKATSISGKTGKCLNRTRMARGHGVL